MQTGGYEVVITVAHVQRDLRTTSYDDSLTSRQVSGEEVNLVSHPGEAPACYVQSLLTLPTPTQLHLI